MVEGILTPEGLEELDGLVLKGYSLIELAKHYGVGRYAFYSWRRKYPEIDQILLKSAKIADEMVEQSLYESCFGRMEKEVTIEKDGQGNIVKQIVKTRYIPPNTQATQFWLINRQRGDWKSAKEEVQVQASGGISFVYDIPNPFEKEKPSKKAPKKKSVQLEEP